VSSVAVGREGAFEDKALLRSTGEWESFIYYEYNVQFWPALWFQVCTCRHTSADGWHGWHPVLFLFLVSHRLPNLLVVCDLTIPGRELKIYKASLVFSTVVYVI